MNLDSILTEWQFRLPAGYPKTKQDYDVLAEILVEKGIDPDAADRLAQQARGETPKPTPNTAFTNVSEFQSFILQKFSVQGQQIIGLPSMYDAVMRHENSADIVRLITTDEKLLLKTGAFPIRGTYGDLYNIIRSTIKIPNGDESELWFAIAFKGLVSGAVAEPYGIEADIQIGDETVSLKNYENTTFDFGSLPTKGTQLLNEFLEIAKLLTGQDISKSKGRDQVNNVIAFLDNEHTESQIRQLIKMSEETDIILIQNVGNRLKKLYSLTDNLDTMIASFCHIIDDLLQEKVLSVGWWGMIVKGNQTLFLESANDVLDAVRCRNGRLSPAIANFHQNKLFVLGSQLSTRVTKKPQD
jgi:hypothetical protein